MMELLNRKYLVMLEKDNTRFLVTYEIKNITKHEAFKLNETLKTNKFYIKKDCYFSSDVFYDEDTSKTIINVTFHLSNSEPERYEQEWIFEEYIIIIQKLLEYIITGKIQI